MSQVYEEDIFPILRLAAASALRDHLFDPVEVRAISFDVAWGLADRLRDLFDGAIVWHERAQRAALPGDCAYCAGFLDGLRYARDMVAYSEDEDVR